MSVGSLGLVAAVIGAAVLGVTFLTGSGSPRDFVKERCTPAGVERDDRNRRADAFTCKQGPSAFAASLAKAHKPADQRSDPSGHFLRYRNQMVGVLGNQGGGSRVLIADDQRNGYGFFFPYVGGWWGTYAGPGETFRGGGPGAGK